MTTPIHQWLEGKRIKVPMQEGKWLPIDDRNEAYNKAVRDFKADLPTLLSAMEAEIRGRIGADERTDHRDSEDNREAHFINAERQRCHAIIHEVLNPQE